LALFSSVRGGRRRALAITCREQDYRRILEQRSELGTAAVANALRILPLPRDVVLAGLADSDPPAGQLALAIERREPMATMVGLPLWLGIAYLVYRNDPRIDSLADFGDEADEGVLGAALYSRWLPLRLAGEPPLVRAQLGRLARAMVRAGQQTLYLHLVQPEWGETLVSGLSARVRRRCRWSTTVLAAVLVLPVLWLIDGFSGLAAGLLVVAFCAYVPTRAMASAGRHLVPGREWRSPSRRSGVRAVGLGLVAGLTVGGLWWLTSVWTLALLIGAALGVMVGGGWLLGRARAERETSAARSQDPRDALVRSRRAGVAAATWGGLLMAPWAALAFPAAVRLAEGSVLRFGGIELDGRATALLVVLPVVAVLAEEVSDAVAGRGSGWQLLDLAFMVVLLVLLPTVVGLVVGGVLGLWFGFVESAASGGLLGFTAGLWIFFLYTAFGRFMGFSEEGDPLGRYPITLTVAIDYIALFAFASPEVAAVLGAVVGVTGGLALGMLGGLGPVVAHQLTRWTLGGSRTLPRDLLSFLDRACELGVMYPTGPGYRFRHRTLAEMLAHSTRQH
jgi:hypothetical protein